MKTTLSALIVVLAIAGAALAVPAIASAETFCVNAGGCAPANEFGDPQSAMNAAQAHAGDDELLLGDKQTPYFGPFSYDPLSKFNALSIRGVGGRPSLVAPTGDTVLTLTDGSLQNVAIITEFGEGLGASVTDVDVKDVKLVGPANVAPDLAGMNVTGPATLEDVEITGGYEPALTVIGALAEQRVVARRMLIHGGNSVGIHVTEFAGLELSDSRVSSKVFGVDSSGSMQIRRSVFETSGPDSVGLNQLSGSRGGYELDHVTLAHTGSPSGSDSAIALTPLAPLDTRLHAVAIAGYTRGFRRIDDNGFPENVVISDSVWDPSNDELAPGTGAFVESGNVHAEPGVVNLAGGDLHPRVGSAVIDRDAISDLSQFADLDGVPALDGNGDGIVRPDAGAFEFRPAAASPAGDASGGSAAAGSPAADLTAPALSRLRLTAGGARVARAARVPVARARRLRVGFTASEAATVKIVPRRVIRGRIARARGSIVRNVAAGRGSIAIGRALRRLGALRPGELRLVLTAKDAAGNRAAKRVLRLRLRA